MSGRIVFFLCAAYRVCFVTILSLLLVRRIVSNDHDHDDDDVFVEDVEKPNKQDRLS